MHSESDPLSESDLRILLDAFFIPGDRASIYFANCLGFISNDLGDGDLDEIHDLILDHDPSDVTDEGKGRGLNYLSTQIFCLSPDEFGSGSGLTLNSDRASTDFTSHRPERLEYVLDRIRSDGEMDLSLLFPDIDTRDLVFRYVSALRQHDNELIWLEVNKRKDAIKRIFQPLKNSRINKYGDEDLGPELSEVMEFLKYAFDDEQFNFYYSVKPLFLTLSMIDQLFKTGDAAPEIPVDAIEFEHWCADQLREQGWDVSVSRASGDQGVDVVASREGASVAIQCKRYTNPIGNKAVQEVFTGAQDTGSGHSCVIGTGGFTNSAVKIAKSTGVILMDAREIESFSELFGFVPSRAVDPDRDDTELVDVEQTSIRIIFPGEVGSLICSLVVHYLETQGPEEMGIDAGTVEYLIDEMGGTTDDTVIEVDRITAGRILYIAAITLKAEIYLDTTNAEVLKRSRFYDRSLIDRSMDEVVLLERLLAGTFRGNAHKFLSDKVEDLGPILKEFIGVKVIEVLVNRP